MGVESFVLATVFDDDGFAIVTFATYKNYLAFGGKKNLFLLKNLSSRRG